MEEVGIKTDEEVMGCSRDRIDGYLLLELLYWWKRQKEFNMDRGIVLQVPGTQSSLYAPPPLSMHSTITV